MAGPSRDWSVFTPIFADHWEPFQHAHPRSQTAYSAALGATMLACGHPAQMGYVADRCRQGGQGTHRVAMRCQASWCWRCATVHVENWVSQVSTRLHAGGSARHLLLTVPALCRTPCSQKAAVVLSALRRCGVPCLDDFESAVRGKALRGGSSTVLHPPGRHGPYQPPRHLLATSGGSAGQGARWEHRKDLPSDLLRRPGQWHLVSLVRQTREPDAITRWVAACCRQSPNGLVPTVQQGHVPSQSQSLARYVAQDVGSPPLSVRRRAR